MKKQILMSLFIAGMAIQANAQDANRELSNLIPTKINQSLIPKIDTVDLGTSAIAWKILYLHGYIYLDGGKFASNQGTQSAFLGYQAGNANAAGNNSGLGYRALFNNTQGSNNTAGGANALRANTNGSYNTSTGSFSLYKNTTGGLNTAGGYSSLYSNTTGSSNTATGYASLSSNTSGSWNTATGQWALNFNTIGTGNTASGYQSLFSNNLGVDNTASGSYSLQKNTTGKYNTAVGFGAGGNNDNNFNCTFIGYDASQDLSTDFKNSTAIGNSSRITATDQVRIGNSSVSSIGGFVDWTDLPSDGRFKQNVKENIPGLQFIKMLRPLTYTIDVTAINKKLGVRIDNMESLAAKAKEIHTGFIAQEVESAARQLGYDFNGIDAPKNDADMYGIRYAKFVVPLVKAVQELSKLNDEKNEKINALEERLEKLEKLSAVQSSISSSKINPASITINDASLEQNIPNPFTNSTTINYTLPQKFTNAHIIITGKSGNVLKQVSLSEGGKGRLQVDASIFSSGAYTYSLYVEGRLISSKQMILNK